MHQTQPKDLQKLRTRRHTNARSKKSLSRQKSTSGPKTNFALKKVRENRDARRIRFVQISHEVKPSIRQKNSPTVAAENHLKFQATKESITVNRPDLNATVTLQLFLGADEPSWKLSATFTDLETAVRFIHQAWDSVWRIHSPCTFIWYRGFNLSAP